MTRRGLRGCARRRWFDDPYRPALTHEEWVSAGRHESLFCARPPASPARDTNPSNGWKSQPLLGLVSGGPDGGRASGMSHRRRKRGFRDGFEVNEVVRCLWRRTGGRRRAEYGRAVAGQGHAPVGGAAQEPADLRPQLENAAQGIRILGGLQVVGEIRVGGEEPILAQGAQRVAGGVRP
jgi:hypothetical protein